MANELPVTVLTDGNVSNGGPASSNMGQLPADQFLTLLSLAPLVAIDLVVTDKHGRLLLGQRVNRPAQGSWFVPGGRIFKGETLDDAFGRISTSELGRPHSRINARLLGVWDHIYEDSVFGPKGAGPSTHYVVLAHYFKLDDLAGELPCTQHSQFRWLHLDEVVRDASVHPNSQAYAHKLNEHGLVA